MAKETIVQEFRDKRKKHRARVVAAENGNILDSTPQGYANKIDMIKTLIRVAVALLEKYAPHLLASHPIA